MYTVNILISRQKKSITILIFNTVCLIRNLKIVCRGTSFVPIYIIAMGTQRNKTRTQHVRYNIIYIIQFSSDRISSFWIFFLSIFECSYKHSFYISCTNLYHRNGNPKRELNMFGKRCSVLNWLCNIALSDILAIAMHQQLWNRYIILIL